MGGRRHGAVSPPCQRLRRGSVLGLFPRPNALHTDFRTLSTLPEPVTARPRSGDGVVVHPCRAGVVLRPCRDVRHHAPLGITRRSASRAVWHPAPSCPAPLWPAPLLPATFLPAPFRSGGMFWLS